MRRWISDALSGDRFRSVDSVSCTSYAERRAVEDLGRSNRALAVFKLAPMVPAYRDAVWTSLGAQKVSFAQLIKIYRLSVFEETRYSPAECTGARKEVVMGNPDPDKISTSYVELKPGPLAVSLDYSR